MRRKTRHVALIGYYGSGNLGNEASLKAVLDLIRRAAAKNGDQSYFFQEQTTDSDDHLPFVRRGVPSADIIDLNYGYQNAYWHTAQDTMDKISTKSLSIVGNTMLEAIRLLNLR